MMTLKDRVDGSSEGAFLRLLFVSALLIRVLFVLAAPYHMNASYYDYDVIAENIVSGNGYSASPGYYWHTKTEPTAMFAPGYTYFYALAKFMFPKAQNSFLFINLVQALFSAVSCLLVYHIGKRLFGRITGILTASLFAVYPMYLHFVRHCSETTLTLFALLLCVCLSLQLARKATWGLAVLLGCVVGGGILLYPSLAAAEPVMFLYVAYCWRYNTRRIVGRLLLAAACTLLVIAPWTIRNYKVFGQLVPIKSCGGLNLWCGNNTFATGTLQPVFLPMRLFYRNEEIREAYPFLNEIKSLGEIERDNRFRDEALRFMKRYPGRAAILMFKKAYYYWVYDKYKGDTLSLRRVRKVPGVVALWQVSATLHVVFVGLAIVGVGLSWIKGTLNADKVFVLGFAFAVSLVYIVTVVGMMRYKVPLDPYIQMFAMSTVAYAVASKNSIPINSNASSKQVDL